MPESELGMSKLKMVETSDVMLPLYEVPYAVFGVLAATGTIKCGYSKLPLRLTGQDEGVGTVGGGRVAEDAGGGGGHEPHESAVRAIGTQPCWPEGADV